ncbi:MAG: MopE-related protein [Myxococcota bacterium]
MFWLYVFPAGPLGAGIGCAVDAHLVPEVISDPPAGCALDAVDCGDPACASTCDADADGHRAPVFGGDDCDDGHANIHPGATELCDRWDNDCDGLTDDADPDRTGAWLWYRDLDGDGFGDPATGREYCDPPRPRVAMGGDCDDGRDFVHPGAPEECGPADRDDDCDGLADEDDPGLVLASATAYYPDADGDGHGAALGVVYGCVAPAGYVETDDDCDDADPTLTLPVPWVVDADGDGVGVGVPIAATCTPPAGYAPVRTREDCDDAVADVHPGAPDPCGDGVDSDCDGGDCAACTEVRVGVRGNVEATDPAGPWVQFEVTGPAYGFCPIVAADVDVLDLDTLLGLDLDVLVLSDIGTVGVVMPEEEEALRAWVALGHGVVSTGVLVQSVLGVGEVTDLVGVDPKSLHAVGGATGELTVLDPSHPLAAGLPPEFEPSPIAWGQVSDVWWDDTLLPGATIVMTAPSEDGVVVAYDGPTGRGALISAMPDFYPTDPAQYQLLYNAVYWAGGYDL